MKTCERPERMHPVALHVSDPSVGGQAPPFSGATGPRRPPRADSLAVFVASREGTPQTRRRGHPTARTRSRLTPRPRGSFQDTSASEGMFGPNRPYCSPDEGDRVHARALRARSTVLPPAAALLRSGQGSSARGKATDRDSLGRQQQAEVARATSARTCLVPLAWSAGSSCPRCWPPVGRVSDPLGPCRVGRGTRCPPSKLEQR